MLIVFYNNGRLGNRLFYFAHFIAYSVKTKKKVMGLFFNEYSKYFEGTCNNQIGLFPRKKYIYSNSFLRRLINFLLFKTEKFAKKKVYNNKRQD